MLTPAEIDTLVKTIHQRSRGESRIASGSAASNVDASQINCTFYDALGRRDSEYLVARAIQCFVPGIPQVYYVGLLAGCNDVELLRRTGVGRDINRHYYTADELRAGIDAAGRSIAAGTAADPEYASRVSGDVRSSRIGGRHGLRSSGRTATTFARLDVDFTGMCASITCSSRGAQSKGDVAWHTLSEARA